MIRAGYDLSGAGSAVPKPHSGSTGSVRIPGRARDAAMQKRWRSVLFNDFQDLPPQARNPVDLRASIMIIRRSS
jgi:hypothetical protein